MYEIKLEQGFATSTEPIKTDPEQGWDQIEKYTPWLFILQIVNLN